MRGIPAAIAAGSLRNRRFAGASTVGVLLLFALAGTTFLLTQYLQLVIGLSPLTAGLGTLPVAGAIAATAPQAPRLARTLVLKLKTSDFRIVTRSISPPSFPADLRAFTELAQSLKARVGLDERLLYRLVGVGVSGLKARELDAQPDLFEADGADALRNGA